MSKVQVALPVPPADKLVPFGGGDYEAIGSEFLSYFTDIGGLKSKDRILDIGCGIGRMAHALAGRLGSRGSYEGFDIMALGIEWCKANITVHYPKFRFQQADVYNSSYNTSGSQQPSAYRFPFPDSSFDFAVAVSLYTHMLPEGISNYLNETARVLKPGGRSISTWFLLDEESRSLINESRSSLKFEHEVGDGVLVLNPDRLEEAVALDVDWVRGAHSSAGLDIKGPVRPGSWCGRNSYLSYQDLILAQR